MIITFFATYIEDKIIIKDNSEMVDMRWFNIKNTNEFLIEMLSGDENIIKELEKFIYNEEIYSEFNIIKTGDKVLQEQVKNIYK
jgi:NADH pyrophosphatase NudC (nudix superfamily)